jgi:hypothetical protein
MLKGRISGEPILAPWDESFRVAGSLKRGWVTRALPIGKLQSCYGKN